MVDVFCHFCNNSYSRGHAWIFCAQESEELGVLIVLETLKTAKKVVGIKQLRRALKESRAVTVFFADDADPMLIAPLALECTAQHVEIVRVATMTELGDACGISVPSACAAIVR